MAPLIMSNAFRLECPSQYPGEYARSTVSTGPSISCQISVTPSIISVRIGINSVPTVEAIPPNAPPSLPSAMLNCVGVGDTLIADDVAVLADAIR